MPCEHPFSSLKEFFTESKPTGAITLRAYCGRCSAPLTKEIMGTPAPEQERPINYTQRLDVALKPSMA